MNNTSNRKNIFGRKANQNEILAFQDSGIEVEKQILNQTSKAYKYDQVDKDFENDIQDVLSIQDWEKLEMMSIELLDQTKAKSNKAFFYLGIALYKMQYYE